MTRAMARTRLAARAKAQKGDPIPRSVAKTLKKAELKKRAADSKKRAEEKKQKAIAARKAREEKKKDRLTLFRNQMFRNQRIVLESVRDHKYLLNIGDVFDIFVAEQ